MFDLTGKTALVTGASGAIGGGIARALHGQGATVALSGTRREALDALAGELKDRVHVLPCDLADKDAVEALVPSAEAKMQKLDILVTNAGVNHDSSAGAVERRGLGQGDRGEPDRDVPPHARGGEGHDAPALGARDRHFLDRRLSPAIRGRAITRPRRRAWWA